MAMGEERLEELTDAALMGRIAVGQSEAVAPLYARYERPLLGLLLRAGSRPDAEDLLQTQIYWKLPNDYRLSAASLTKGVPVTVEDPNSKLARGYADLVKKLSGGAHSGAFRSIQESGSSRLRKLFGNDRGVRNVS